MARTAINPQTTQISLESFKTITDTDGTFTTWTDIVNEGKQSLPVNYEIIEGSIKGYTEITGGNIIFDNIETKNVAEFRDDLERNNVLTQDKIIMYIRDEFMIPFEYSILDRKSAVDWGNIISASFTQAFLSKRDFENALSIDALYKYCLASGNFIIVPNANTTQTDAEGNIDDKAYKSVAVQMRKIFNKASRTRTPFSKGFTQKMVRWLVGQDFSLDMMNAQTAYWTGSEKAYTEFKEQDRVYKMLNIEYKTSLYLQDEFQMAEFKKSDGTIMNEGSGTGNWIRPMDFTELVATYYYPEAIALYKNTIGETVVPKMNSRTYKVWTQLWRQGAAMKPIYQNMNKIFISKLPRFVDYTDFNGNSVDEIDTNTLDGMNKLRENLKNEQPDLYQAFSKPLEQSEFDAWKTTNIIKWKGGNEAPATSPKGKKKDKK